MFKRNSQLHQDLLNHPNEMYVDNNTIAVLFPDGRMLAIKGDFKGITAEEANLKLQRTLTDLMQ